MNKYTAEDSLLYVEEDVHEYQVDFVPKHALNYFEQKAFTWKGIVSDELLGGIKRVLLGSLSNGGTLASTLQSLEDVFAPYVGSPQAVPDQEQRSPYRLETLVRTNTTEAYNAGRKSMFDADPFVVGYRFSAILDRRTTPCCKFLHGKILPVDSDALEQLTPPRHYNCRSLLIPVTRLERNPLFITPEEIQKGLELSGRDFAEEQVSRSYSGVTFQSPVWEVLQSL